MILKNYQLDCFIEQYNFENDFIILSIDTKEKTAQAILEADLKIQIDFEKAVMYF